MALEIYVHGPELLQSRVRAETIFNSCVKAGKGLDAREFIMSPGDFELKNVCDVLDRYHVSHQYSIYVHRDTGAIRVVGDIDGPYMVEPKLYVYLTVEDCWEHVRKETLEVGADVDCADINHDPADDLHHYFNEDILIPGGKYVVWKVFEVFLTQYLAKRAAGEVE